VRIGRQVPTFERLAPESVDTTAADIVVDMAAAANMPLDDWQQHVARGAFARRPDGKWAAFETALVIPRQNGKSALIEAMILAALFVWRERRIVYSAHKFNSAQEVFFRLRTLIEESEFADEVANVYTANGKESILLRSGARVGFVARSKGSLRGFTGDRIIFDEAYDLPTSMLGNMIPALAARSESTRTGPQVVYASSAAHASSVQLHALGERARSADPGKLYFAEWRADDGVADDDVDAWYEANPALGIRISEEFVADELRALSANPDEFRRERLGIPDPLPATEDELAKLPADRWSATTTATPPDVVPGELVLAYDVHNGVSSVSMASGTLSAAYVEIVAHQSGDGWLPARLVELALKWKPTAIGLDSGNGPSAAILGPIREAFEDAGLDPEVLRPLSGRAYRDACGGFFQAVVDGTLRRPVVSPDNLDTAGCKAPERVIGDAFVWDRRRSSVPLAPLVAATVARSLLSEKPTTDKFWFA
jgi:hypothetical protein